MQHHRKGHLLQTESQGLLFSSFPFLKRLFSTLTTFLSFWLCSKNGFICGAQALFYRTADILTDADCVVDNAAAPNQINYQSPGMTCAQYDGADGSCEVSRLLIQIHAWLIYFWIAATGLHRRILLWLLCSPGWPQDGCNNFWYF